MSFDGKHGFAKRIVNYFNIFPVDPIVRATKAGNPHTHGFGVCFFGCKANREFRISEGFTTAAIVDFLFCEDLIEEVVPILVDGAFDAVDFYNVYSNTFHGIIIARNSTWVNREVLVNNFELEFAY